MKSYITTVQRSNELFITIPDELLTKLKITEGTEAKISEKNGALEIEFLTEELELELPDDVYLNLAMEAHEKNVTLNTHINDVLIEILDQYELKS
jgi:hypothetical protein